MERYKYIKDLSPATQRAIFERIEEEYVQYEKYHDYLDTEIDDEHIDGDSYISNISCHIYHKYYNKNTGRWEREREFTIRIPRQQIITFEEEGKWK